MSPSTSDAVRPGRSAPWSARAWKRITGRRARWTVLLEPEGALAWPASRSVDGAGPARFSSFEAWAAGHPGSEALLLASSHLLHTLRLSEEPGATPAQATARRLLRYHGSTAATWPVAVDAEARFACALHGIAAEPLVDAARAHDVVLGGLVPLWSEALRRAGPTLDPARRERPLRFVLVERTIVTVLALDGDGLADVQHRFLDAPLPSALDSVIAQLDDATEAPGGTSIAGWGIAGTGGDRFPFGPLAADAAGARWLRGEDLADPA